MGKPRTPVRTAGEIRVYPQASGKWQARTLYRDPDGQLRQVNRVGKTKAAAKRALNEALADRQHRQSGGLGPNTLFAVAAKMWLIEVKRLQKPSTFDTYRRNLRKRVMPAFGALTLRECDDVPTVFEYLRSLEEDAGLSANMARGCRTVLSGVLTLACQHGAIDRNPVPQSGRIRGGAGPARALTDAERIDILDKVDADERAGEFDLPHLIRYFMGTGVRLSEALGLRWCRVDLDAGVVVHGDNLVTVTRLCVHCGESRPDHVDRIRCAGADTMYEAGPGGLMLDEPKTAAGYRVLPLPDFVATMLRVRFPGHEFLGNPVFPNFLGTWRDRANTSEEIREFRTRAGYPWLTSHVFRKTAITIMDRQGLSAREIAGYAGHARPSITQDVYMDKRPLNRSTADALQLGLERSRNG